MKPKKLLLSTLAAFLYLIVVNGLLFPLVFPDGPPEKYMNQRPEPLLHYHLLALLSTSFLMSFLYPLIARQGPPWREGLKAGAIMALFVSLPMSLHVYAMVEVPLHIEVFPALWVIVIWGVAGSIVGIIHGPAQHAESHQNAVPWSFKETKET